MVMADKAREPMHEDDITLVAEGQQFVCCKAKLIASSDYFRAMFSNNFTENGKNTIELKDIDAECLLMLIQHVKCGNYTIPSDSVLALLETAAMLQFISVQSACEQQLLASLSCDSCLEVYFVTSSLGLTQTAMAALTVALWNFSEIRNKPQFLQLSFNELVEYMSHPSLYSGPGGEWAVWEALVSWIQDWLECDEDDPGVQSQMDAEIAESMLHLEHSESDDDDPMPPRPTTLAARPGVETLLEYLEHPFGASFEKLWSCGDWLHCPDMPHCVGHGAACAFKGRLMVFTQEMQLLTYYPSMKKWSAIPVISPSKQGYRAALTWSNSVYLIDNCSNQVYKFSPEEGKTVTNFGRFKTPPVNVCVVDGKLYSFSHDDLDDSHVIEVLDVAEENHVSTAHATVLQTREHSTQSCKEKQASQIEHSVVFSKEVWREKETDPHVFTTKCPADATFSLGCFPLLKNNP
nr:uncharacterized protein LOC128698307 [Cherax quadricarinatus]